MTFDSLIGVEHLDQLEAVDDVAEHADQPVELVEIILVRGSPPSHGLAVVIVVARSHPLVELIELGRETVLSVLDAERFWKVKRGVVGPTPARHGLTP